MRSILAVFIAFCSATAAAQEIVGRVDHVFDGDTFPVAVGRDDIRVRIARIDAPEHGQPYADAAKRALSRLVRRQTVLIVVDDKDDYGRIVGHVFLGEMNVGEALVAQGYAWAFKRYRPSRTIRQLEKRARSQRLGLWADPSPTPPWEWREAERRRASQRSNDCRIKGNINSRGIKIYHVPGSKYYEQTKISGSRGERWFCTTREAREAGWRASRAG